MISAALADPTTASQSGAQNRLRMDVRARNCRMPAGWRLSTSSARKSAMNLLSPAELADESARRGVAAKGERREVQTGRPSLGPLDQHGQIGDA